LRRQPLRRLAKPLPVSLQVPQRIDCLTVSLEVVPPLVEI
jgi:hypothetical protein